MINKRAVQQTMIWSIWDRPEYWPDVSVILNSLDFDEGPFRTIWQLYEYESSKGRPINQEMLIGRIDDALANVLLDCKNNAICISRENILVLARELHNETLREHIAPRILKIAFDMNSKNESDTDLNFQELVSELRLEVENLIYGLDSEDNAKELSKCVIEYLSHLQKGKPRYKKTGFSGIDKCIGGYAPGDFNVIAARSGGGKSDFAISLSLECAKRGTKVLYESLEMIRDEITSRIISNKAGVSSSGLRDILLDSQDWENISIATDAIHDYPFLIDARPTLTIPELEAQINKHKPEIVIVDNLDLLKSSVRRSEKWRETEDNCHALKALAKRAKVCIIALDQLNRTADAYKEGVPPKMSDLYGGSAIEHDATWIIALTKEQQSNIVKAHILKSRAGMSNGSVTFSVNFNYHKWIEVDERYE